MNQNKKLVNAYKKPIPVIISPPLLVQRKIQTLEGVITAPIGSRIVTGISGEQYPIDEKIYRQYVEIKEGIYIKEKKIIQAQKMNASFHVLTPWGERIRGKKGNYLIYQDGYPYSIVNETIFQKTYTIIK